MADDRRPLDISEEVARAQRVPDDLDSTQREPYAIPSTRRRRSAAIVYFVAALLAISGVAAGLPRGLSVTAAALAALAVWHLVSAWRISILDPAALETANRTIEFPVGHASAAVGFDTWRARPIWNVLVFSSDDPPSQRGLVRVDAVDGHVVESYSERISEAI